MDRNNLYSEKEWMLYAERFRWSFPMVGQPVSQASKLAGSQMEIFMFNKTSKSTSNQFFGCLNLFLALLILYQ